MGNCCSGSETALLTAEVEVATKDSSCCAPKPEAAQTVSAGKSSCC